MTLLITAFAAIAVTVIWYLSEKRKELYLGALALMYWGASLMWLVDAAVEFAEVRAAYFAPEAGDMLNDAFLGCSVAVLGLLIWLAVVLIQDPTGTVRKALQKKNG